jgi:two-component system cell cycle sensor histidine kinase PleC
MSANSNGNGNGARQALQEAESALEKALSEQDALKEHVMSEVKQFAHDIKNPLTAMIGLSKLMKMGLTPAEKVVPNAAIIHQSSTRILELCEDMLLDTEAALQGDGSKSKAANENKIQDVDAAEMIEEVTSLYTDMAKERDIRLSATVSEDFPKINTIPRHLYRSLTNILSNAMKFTPGGGTIEINADVDESEDAVIFVVRDSGEGIPAEQIPHILKPYKTTVSPHGDKGTGLGLSIVNQLMLELGGKMEITSREHEGTTVTLRFPKNMTR